MFKMTKDALNLNSTIWLCLDVSQIYVPNMSQTQTQYDESLPFAGPNTSNPQPGMSNVPSTSAPYLGAPGPDNGEAPLYHDSANSPTAVRSRNFLSKE